MPAPSGPPRRSRAIPSDRGGLVLVHGFSYAAPSGDYWDLRIEHVGGCHNDGPGFDDEVQHIGVSLDLHSFDAVEKVCFGFLATRGCASSPVSAEGCHVDRSRTLGFYARFHSPEGSSQSFAPPNSQVVSLDFHSAMASDPMTPSASWPSIDEDRSQDPLYIPCVIEIDDSQRCLPSPFEPLFSGERELYRGF